MAYAVIGGLMVATLLTLVFLPALYVAWFRVQPAQSMGGNSSAGPDTHPRATEIVERLRGIAARSEPALQQS
jgi:multidrug efflux pump